MKATQEQVSAMKARLAERMEQRKLEADIQEAINLVHRGPFGQPQEVAVEAAEPGEDSGGFHQGALVAFLMYGMRCFL